MIANLFKTLLVSSLFFFIFVCYPSLFIACFFSYSLSLFVLFLLLFCLCVILSLLLFFLYIFCLSCYSVFFITLSFLLFCLYVILSLFFLSFFFLLLCHSVYSLSFCLFSCFCRTSSPPYFPFILASFLPFHLFIFWYFCLNI